MRMILSLMVGVVALSQVAAQELDNPWRATVDGQIEAFRTGDAETALEFAGAGFKATYTDAERFLADVERAGYGPIVASRSHSFGDFREVGDEVVQIVNLVGPDRSLYEAIYRLKNEPDEGWRVQAVVMRRAQGLGV